MAERISRGVKVATQIADQRVSRVENGHRKRGERARKDVRMAATVKAGKLPYIPAVMSWLSVKLKKPATQIVQSDIEKLLKS